MEGASSGSEYVPEEVTHVLNWNPPELKTFTKSFPRCVGKTRVAAFYDKHLASGLILRNVVYLDTLVSSLAGIVDQGIQDVSNNGLPPKNRDMLVSPQEIRRHLIVEGWKPRHEIGLASTYGAYTSTYCAPIASTLALHPSSEQWGAAIEWSLDLKEARWAIADGVLRMSSNMDEDGYMIQTLIENVDPQVKTILKGLAARDASLAVWKFKYMTVGTAEVMQGIVDMGKNHATFQWKTCTPGSLECTHSREKLEKMKEFREDCDAGCDPRSPPWIHSSPVTTSSRPSTPLRSNLARGGMTSPLPIVPAISTSPSTPLRDGLRSASSATPRVSYMEVSSSSMEGGKGASGKRPHNDSDSEYGSPKKSEPPEGAKREVNAQSFLQQTWAEAVRNNVTVVVLNSGNHEVIGIRHRATQTLYISPIIQPHLCSDPAYGKIQVGVYIAAIKETIDREKQRMENEARDPDPFNADLDLDIRRTENAEEDSDGDLGDYP